MAEAICSRCSTLLGDEDVFCGTCGAARADAESGPAADTAESGAPVRPLAAATTTTTRPSQGVPLREVPYQGAWPDDHAPDPRRGTISQQWASGFFGHNTAVPPDVGVLSNATRYLCAAAYLRPSFANRVIDELVASHRAVAPSRGIDLEPIIRHCLRSRRMQLIRDILLGVLLFLGLIVAQGPLIFMLVVTFFFSFMRRADWQRRSIGKRVLVLLVAAVAIFIFGGLIVVFLILLVFLAIFAAARIGLGLLAILGLAYLVLLVGTLIRYTYVTHRTLAERLGPGAVATAFEPQSPRVENRIAEVRQAQHGNLTLYANDDPFVGTGITPFNIIRDDERVWSIAIELNRKGAKRRGLLDARAPGEVSIDPVELHGVLRRRLLELNDPALPANERVLALTVDDHVVGEGRFPWDSPLIDPQRLIPYSQASPEAIDALIRNPQARLRYYQRVTISDEGQTVLAGPRPVIGSVDREIIISAFVYVAVEGHMFYLQFVPASLGPVDREYHLPDNIPKVGSSRFLVKVVQDTASTAFFDIIGAVPRSFRTLRMMWKEYRQFREELTMARDYTFADVGARVSVREQGSDWWPQSYIQRLDASKYTKLVERLVIETVLDYLDSKDVDTAAYRARAEAIYNSGTIVAGNIQGAGIAVGHGSSASVSSG